MSYAPDNYPEGFDPSDVPCKHCTVVFVASRADNRPVNVWECVLCGERFVPSGAYNSAYNDLGRAKSLLFQCRPHIGVASYHSPTDKQRENAEELWRHINFFLDNFD